MDGWTDGRMDGWTDGRMDGWTDGRMDGWTDGRMDEWMNGWRDEWIDGENEYYVTFGFRLGLNSLLKDTVKIGHFKSVDNFISPLDEILIAKLSQHRK